MNILNIIQKLKEKQKLFYENNPSAFWIQSAATLALSGFTFIKTLKGMNAEFFAPWRDIINLPFLG